MVDCVICYENTENKIKECNHSVCISCLKIYIKKNDTCPYCRQSFDITDYKYVKPKHKKNLKLSKSKINFFNKFLKSRYFLMNNKHQSFYANLMVRYHGFYYIYGKYIDGNDIYNRMTNYECLQLYVFVNSIKFPYNSLSRQYFRTLIEDRFLCD